MSGTQPSPWPVLWPECKAVETASPAATGYAVQAATNILHGLSGRRYGLETVTVRPCRRDCYGWPFPNGWYQWEAGPVWPVLFGGVWMNLTCGSCQGGCQCTTLQEVLLPGPVASVTEVKVDGVVLASGGSAYQLVDGRVLVRTDGGSWPRCNDLAKPDTAAGTWSVTARYGLAVPTDGQLAVGELACEVLRAMGGEDCSLPRQVTSLARQGVTISFPDPTDLLDKGKLGLVLSDRFIQSVNPHGLQRRARVASPDTLAGRSRRWT
jgi:hypothetical protein